MFLSLGVKLKVCGPNQALINIVSSPKGNIYVFALILNFIYFFEFSAFFLRQPAKKTKIKIFLNLRFGTKRATENWL